MTGPIRHILVASDCSDASAAALDHAVKLARSLRARVHVLHVVEDPLLGDQWRMVRSGWRKAALRACVIDAAACTLARLLQPARRRGVFVNSEICIGRPADAICDAARQHEADLIVLGTHGRNGSGPSMSASVADHVVRHAPCAVLTVRPQASRPAIAEPEVVDNAFRRAG